jgi:hypothetical protein
MRALLLADLVGSTHLIEKLGEASWIAWTGVLYAALFASVIGHVVR